MNSKLVLVCGVLSFPSRYDIISITFWGSAYQFYHTKWCWFFRYWSFYWLCGPRKYWEADLIPN